MTFKLSIPTKVNNLKIGQYPDIHLGAKISDFNKINSQTGILYQWEEQIKALEKATDILISNNITVAIMPGDVFDRRSNISEKLQDALKNNILKLVKNDIAVVIITGNHDFPHSLEDKALIARYDGIGEYINVVPIYKSKYEKVAINDEILIHCIPQCFNKETFREELSKVKKDSSFKTNILTTHIGVQGAGISQYENIDGWLNKVELDMDIDYIALGDYHEPLLVSEKAAYAGVLAKNRFDERNFKHSVIIFDGHTQKIEFKYYSTRKMEQYDIECKYQEVGFIDTQLKKISDELDPEKYIKIIFHNIEKSVQKQIDTKNIINIKKKAFYSKLEYRYFIEITSTGNSKHLISTAIKSIKDEVKSTLLENVVEEEDIERLYNIYINEICTDN